MDHVDTLDRLRQAHNARFTLVGVSLPADGDFVLQHAMAAALRKGSETAVVLVGLAQILLHTTAVQRRLGNNIAALREQRRFAFIDGLTQLTIPRDLRQSAAQATNTNLNSNAPPPNVGDACLNLYMDDEVDDKSESECKSDRIIRSMFHTIRHQVERVRESSQSNGGKNRPVLLVLESISVLALVGVSPIQILKLCHACTAMMREIDEGQLMISFACEEDLIGNTTQDILATSLMHSADMLIFVRPLESGHSRDIHGQLNIVAGGSECWRLSNKEPIAPIQLQYKTTEMNVRLFATGYAAGIL